MFSTRRLALRTVWVFASALFVVLWPKNYGMRADTWWKVLPAIAALAYRSMFVGWCACLLLVRPYLYLRVHEGDEPRPMLSAPQAVRLLFKGLEYDR